MTGMRENEDPLTEERRRQGGDTNMAASREDRVHSETQARAQEKGDF